MSDCTSPSELNVKCICKWIGRWNVYEIIEDFTLSILFIYAQNRAAVWIDGNPKPILKPKGTVLISTFHLKQKD